MEPRRGRRTSAPRALAGVVVTALALSLPACSSGSAPDEPDTAAGGSASAVGDPADPGAADRESANDAVSFEDLPQDFPSDEVSLTEGSIASVERAEYDGIVGFTVIIDSRAESTDAVAEGAETLVEGGLVGDVPEPDGTGPLTFRNDDRSIVVVLTGTRVPPGSLLTYTVEVGPGE